jgi:hypothetical protein
MHNSYLILMLLFARRLLPSRSFRTLPKTDLPAEVSSFLIFLSILQDILFLLKIVTFPLMSLSTMPLFPLMVLSCPFTSSTISFFPTLLSKYSSGCAPSVCNPVILEINSTSNCTILSIHMISPCTWDNNCLTQFLPCPKCSISNRFIILKLYNPVIHCTGSIIGLPRGPISRCFLSRFLQPNMGPHLPLRLGDMEV